jgi:hypothetical protein
MQVPCCWFFAAAVAAVLGYANAKDNQRNSKAKPVCARSGGLYKSSMVAWDDLSAAQKSGARTCGFSKLAWDGPTKCRACFLELSGTMQSAVLALGTDGRCWNQGMSSNGLHCPDRDSSKPLDPRCRKDSGIYNSSYVSWDSLSPAQQLAAKTCDYDQAAWDGVKTCIGCYEDLDKDKKQAVIDIGSDAECWNKGLEPYHVNCKQLMRSNPDIVKRKALYAEVMSDFTFRPQGVAGSASHRVPFAGALNTTTLFLLSACMALIALIQMKKRDTSEALQSPSDEMVEAARYTPVPDADDHS